MARSDRAHDVERAAPGGRRLAWLSAAAILAALLLAAVVDVLGTAGGSGATLPVELRSEVRTDSVATAGAEMDVAVSGRGAQIALRLDDGSQAAEARAVVLDDRDARVLQTGWIGRGNERAMSIAPELLAVGPIRARLQTRGGDGLVGDGAGLLISPELSPGTARVRHRIAASGRRVALVFDDGLDADAMRQVVATLRQENASATFCLNGSVRDRWDPPLRETLRAAIDDGVVELCSHGYGHRTDERTTRRAALRDLGENARVLEATLGVPVRGLYRPPHGRLGPGIEAAAEELGFTEILLWDVDPGDYRGAAPETIAAEVVHSARAGSITVMHLQPATAAALPQLIAGLRSRDLEPMGAGRMLRAADRTVAGPTLRRSDASASLLRR